MKIRVTGHNGEPRFNFEESGPWIAFQNAILEQGHTICSSNWNDHADAIICNSYNRQIKKYLSESAIPISKRTLVLWEPFAVEATRYKESTLREFGTVWAPSVVWAERVSGNPFNWPQDEITQNNKSIKWTNRENFSVMIQGNKFSSCTEEFYSLRRKVICELSSQLDLYGTGWNRGINYDIRLWLRSAIHHQFYRTKLQTIAMAGYKYKNYKGTTADKIQTLQRYRIAVVIENSQDYISEKLFDAVNGGCIAVYVGPPLSSFGIPEESAIQCEPVSNAIKATILKLISLDAKEQEKIALAQQEALRPISREWRNTKVLYELATKISSGFQEP